MSATGQNPTAPSGTPETPPPSTGQATQRSEQGRQQRQQAHEATERPDGFWGRFPTVPEDQRSVLEPHLKSVQAYVTRLEQTTAPIRELRYTPQQVQGLAQFAKAFDANPLQTFLTMAQQLQRQGVIHDDLDLEVLAAVVQGQEPPDSGEEYDDGTGDPWETAPPWAQEIRSKFQTQEQREQETARAQQEAREDQVLNNEVKVIKNALKADGWPEEYLNNEGLERDLIARFIVHNGSRESVLNELKNLRTSLLQGIVKPDGEPVELSRGVPGGASATSRRARQRPGDSFAQASAGAEQHLRAALRNDRQNG